MASPFSVAVIGKNPRATFNWTRKLHKETAGRRTPLIVCGSGAIPGVGASTWNLALQKARFPGEGVAKWGRTLNPRTTVLWPAKQMGFARRLNMAIERATSRYLVLVSSYAYLVTPRHFLAQAYNGVEWLKSHSYCYMYSLMPDYFKDSRLSLCSQGCKLQRVLWAGAFILDIKLIGTVGWFDTELSTLYTAADWLLRLQEEFGKSLSHNQFPMRMSQKASSKGSIRLSIRKGLNLLGSDWEDGQEHFAIKWAIKESSGEGRFESPLEANRWYERVLSEQNPNPQKQEEIINRWGIIE